MSKPSVRRDYWHGLAAITLRAGRYQATVLPKVGANLIALSDVRHGYHFMRTPKPEQIQAFTDNPNTYGNPVLFLPNRYQDGAFTIAGIHYQFPINEAKTHNFIHGFLYRMPWDGVFSGCTPELSVVVLRQRIRPGHPFYRYFPHWFTITLTYLLSPNGLRQLVRIHNQGDTPLPVLLGFHTAFRIPFAAPSQPQDVSIHVDVGLRWELNDRGLPTGATVGLSPAEQGLQGEGMTPGAEALDNHYSVAHFGQSNVAVIRDRRIGAELVYRVGSRYRYWMVWNGGGDESFVCVEPQTNRVNAPNLNLSLSNTGVAILKKGQSWRESAQLSVRRYSPPRE